MKRFCETKGAKIFWALAGCGIISACSTSPPDDPIVILTGWGTPIGFSEPYNEYISYRTSGGEIATSADQPCTQWHTGEEPYRVEMLRAPFAVSNKVKGFERVWDSSGVYTLSDDGETYIPVAKDALPLPVASLDDETRVIALKDYESAGSRRKYGPDPRNGIDYLDGTYRIEQPNGVADFFEMDRAYRPRIVGMMGWDPERPPYFPDYMGLEKQLITGYIEDYFDNRIEWTEGYYSAVPGLSKHLKDTAPEVAERGYRKIVIAKPITDHNIYANIYWDRNLALQSLCRAGYETDEFDIRQVRMHGRTPEYNRIMLDNLHRHLELLDTGDEVAVIYTTHGLPWPGPTPVGPMSNAMPWINEVFHENSYLNFLSFKNYVKEFEDDYAISFAKTGGSGSEDARTRNLFAYSEYNPDAIGYADDPLRYLGLRDNIEDAILNQKKEEVVVVLSHWGHTFWVLLTSTREAWDIPLNSIEEMAAGEYRKVWCERYTGPGEYEQLQAENSRCPEGYTRLQITEAFEDFTQDYATNYANRIRGGIERFGIFPDLEIKIFARGDVSRQYGGSATVTDGLLAGTAVIVPPDPQPLLPEGYRWENRYRPASHKDPNTGIDAVRAINEYAAMGDFLDGAKDDFTLVIGTQEMRVPGEAMPVHHQAVTPAVFAGPHRTLFNAPATVTLKYDPDQVSDPLKLRPYVFNEIRREFEPVPPVLVDQEPWLDTGVHTLSFHVQTLGQFILVDEGRH